MIDGIRIAPYVYAIRRTSRIDGGAQTRYLECAQCLECRSEAERAEMRCGWVPAHRLPEPDPEPDPDKRLAHPWLPDGAPKPVSQDCPGWLIAQPEVVDALHAHLWWEKGQLDRYVRDQPVSPFLELYVDAVTGAVADLDIDRERERERERRAAELRRR